MIKAWSGVKARSSLHSKHSVITPLWIHSGFSFPAHGKTAPCSLHFKSYSNVCFFACQATTEVELYFS